MSARWRLAAVLLALAAPGAGAQGQAPGDVPRDHWAYAAVEDLAAKGLIKGYPPQGRFFGNRTVTRYEMATIVQRILQRVDELYAPKGQAGQPAPPLPDRQMEEIRRLVDSFKVELTVIGADLQRVRDQMSELRGQVESARQATDRAAAGAAEAKAAADQAQSDIRELQETITLQRVEFENLSKQVNSHKISGYLQARFESFLPGANDSLFTEGGAGGSGTTPSTGGPAVGGPRSGFLVRRARLKLSGPVTTRAGYTAQLDVPSTGSVAVKDAFVEINDLPIGGRSVLTAGLFPPPFGYELVHSSSTRESPERALGFSDSTAPSAIFRTPSSTPAIAGDITRGSALPLFLNQDRDVGLMVTWNVPDNIKPRTRIKFGAFNGEGRTAGGQRNVNDHIDLVGRIESTFLGDTLDLGLSGYYGALSVRGAPAAGAPTPFRRAYRMLAGADARWFSPWGTTLRAEWAGGLMETTPGRERYLQGNHAHAWYVAVKHPLGNRLDVALKYDEFYPISQAGKTVGGLRRMDYVRKTLQGGLLYYLDDATRFRLWYLQGLTPYDPSAATAPRRARLGLLTAEVQITY